MKKKVTFDKQIEFPTMIGEITAISLEEDLSFVDNSNLEGNLLLTGKYRLTEASRLDEDFDFKIPTEIALTEKLDLDTVKVDITDFSYELDSNNSIICHIELTIEGVEVEEDDEIVVEKLEERECDGDIEKEIEIPKKEEVEEEVEEEQIEEDNKRDSLFIGLKEDKESYGTFLVYIIRQNESLNSIIEKYNTSLEEIEKYNDIKDLSIGTKLIIPLLND